MSGPFGVPQRPAVEVCRLHIEAIEAVMQAPGGCSETWLTPVLDLLYMVRNLAKADPATVPAAQRLAAVGLLTAMVERAINEFYLRDADRAYREARAAFNALGVTDEELGWDEGKGWWS